MYDAAAVTGLPTYAGLRAVREGRAVAVLGEGWQAADPFSTYWIPTDLQALVSGNSAGIGAAADAPARFTAFGEGTS